MQLLLLLLLCCVQINLSSGEATCVDATTGASVGLLGNGKVQPAAGELRFC
jgi:hypothetical protein